MIDYDSRSVDWLTWDFVSKATVGNLISGEWDDNFNGLINLKSLDVSFNTLGLDHIGNFCQLEHFALHNVNNTDLQRILEKNRKLVSLEIWKADNEMMYTIGKFGLGLKTLVVRFNDGSLVNDDQFWESFAKLIKL